ncbi:MAG TPA: hypothetical protein VK943_20500 [Arenibaculum sp.]|nr:hypothetical protein [Arenibaculum sp.]
MPELFYVLLAAIALTSFVAARGGNDVSGFYRGVDVHGREPGVLMLTFSQVTTWIFARSLLTAAILAFHYGILGGIAYAAYYLCFFTGGVIIDRLRFRAGHGSVQSFLRQHYGRVGTTLYNVTIALRLLSEVFANVLVVGIIFGSAGTVPYAVAVVAISLATLAYSMKGGLFASLRTDVLQMGILLAALGVLLVVLTGTDAWSAAATLSSGTWQLGSGLDLLLVALLQAWSYPLHDPVMMDRGLIANRRTTRLSFLYAGMLGIACVLAFSLLGVHAGLNAHEGETMNAALERLLGAEAMMVFNVALIISAVSTLDSTLSSAAKLVVQDLGWGSSTVRHGRAAMLAFMLGGLAFVFLGNDDIYAAVAISGTASMYLTPVVFFTILGNRTAPVWSYAASFAIAFGGAILYLLESSGIIAVFEPWFGITASYTKLLAIVAFVFVTTNLAFVAGLLTGRHEPAAWQGKAGAEAEPAGTP